MGCCFSRSDGPNSRYPGGAPSASARAINIPPAGSAAAALAAAVSPGASPRNVANNAARGEGGEAGGISSGSSLSTRSTIASQQLRTGSAAAAATASAAAGASSQPPPQDLSIHINKPIRRRQWTSRNRVWTRHAIDRERTDFFDTRVTGRTEIWQTLHAAFEILWAADLANVRRDNTEGPAATATATASPPPPTSPTSPTTGGSSAGIDEARATAQTILDAADITLPTGDMAQGAYDAFGNFYALPAWIVSDPTNLVNDSEHNSDLDETKGALDDIGSDADLSDESEEDDEEEEDNGDDTCNDEGQQLTQPGDTEAAPATARPPRIRRRRRREEKGKAVVAAANQVAVRARLSATSHDVVILLGRDETVRSLAHRISEAAKLPRKTRIRIAYLGKILKDNAPLLAQGWKEGHVVNALVFGATA